MKRILGVILHPIGILLILLAVYALMRIPSLGAMPIFTDEAIYVRWSQIGSRDASWRFISLTDGKQPLFTWGAMAAMRVIHDPLLASRAISVVAGALSVVGLFLLGWELFASTTVGLLASLLYVLSPFALLYDRMALYDSLVATFFIWNTYLTVLFARYNRLDSALLLGLGVGVGLLNKTSAFFSLYLLPFSLLLFDFRPANRTKRFLKFIGLSLVVVVLSVCIYSILRLSPYFYIIAQKDALFVYPLKEWIRHPFEFFLGNWHGLFDWLTFYVTVPLFALGVFTMIEKGKWLREKLFLLLYFILPFTALALFGRTLYPRYILFMVMPLFLLISWGIIECIRIFGKKVGIMLGVLCLVQSLSMSMGILRDIKTAPIHPSDRGQYISDWPAGWGVADIVSYLDKAAQQEKITVYTEGTFGLMPYALEIYLIDNKNIEIKGIWPFPSIMPASIAQKTQKNPVYLLMYQSQTDPAWPVEKILSIAQGNNPGSRMRLYKILPQETP